MTKLIATDRTGRVINEGDTITDFRGDTAIFVRATRASLGGRTGKVEVISQVGEPIEAMPIEYYQTVFDLTVSIID